MTAIPFTAPIAPTPHGALAEIIAKKTEEIEAAGFAQWDIQSCRWCREGYGPPVESCITPGWFVHPDSPVGRVACGIQDRSRFPKCADCGRSDGYHGEGCSGRYNQ